MKNNPSKGFTLVELLISITILGLIVVLVFGALWAGVRAWEKGESEVESNQVHRVVLDLMKRQLTSSWAYEDKSAPQTPPLFEGDGKSLEFLSALSLDPGNRSGLVYVKYKVEPESNTGTERFLLFEKSRALMGHPGETVIEEDSFHELITGAKSIQFAYLKRSIGGAAQEWLTSWDSKTENGLPLAVQITLEEEKESIPLRVLARIGAQVEI